MRVVAAERPPATPPPDPATDVRVGGTDGAAPAESPRRAEPPSAPSRSVTLPDTVAVVGDSLTLSASEEITGALSGIGVRAVVVDARESRRMATGSAALPSGVAAIEEVLTAHRPDVWVVALGTNDVASEVATERFVADLRATLGALPAEAPIAWVDVWIRDRRDAVAIANALLRAELERRRAPTVVVDWSTAAPTEGLVTGDGVHLTQAGQDRFAAAIAAAVVELGVTVG